MIYWTECVIAYKYDRGDEDAVALFLGVTVYPGFVKILIRLTVKKEIR